MLCALVYAHIGMYAQDGKTPENGASASVVQSNKGYDGSVYTPVADAKTGDVADEKRTWPLYVKTNAVAWALLITNVEVETSIKPHLSVALNVNCSTWDFFRVRTKYRVLSAYPSIRYWLDASNNKGMFVGAHIGIASYNFASNGEYRTQDHDGECPAIGVGISGGYRMPISRNGRWMLEGCIGAGVYSLHYDKFYNQPNGLRASTTKEARVCLDHLSVSLCYRFDLKRGR